MPLINLTCQGSNGFPVQIKAGIPSGQLASFQLTLGSTIIAAKSGINPCSNVTYDIPAGGGTNLYDLQIFPALNGVASDTAEVEITQTGHDLATYDQNGNVTHNPYQINNLTNALTTVVGIYLNLP